MVKAVLLLTCCWLVFWTNSSSVRAFTPAPLGIGALLFPVRGSELIGVSESSNKKMDILEASDFFVESFWTAKVGGGARRLTDVQRRQLEQSQTAEFNKRYGGRRRTSELLIMRNSKDEIIACVGVEVDRILDDSLTGSLVSRSPLMSNLAVSRAYRRRGLAEKLVEAVELLVRKEWGYEECFLYVEERNRAAIKLYEKLGYRRVWRDDAARTLLPTAKGDLETAGTVIVCMRKNLNANLLERIFR